jgi:hypothetical protein
MKLVAIGRKHEREFGVLAKRQDDQAHRQPQLIQ